MTRTRTRRTTTLLAATLLAATFLSTAAHADALTWTFRYLIINSQDDDTLSSAIGALASAPQLRDRANCDVLAEILWRNKQRKLDLDKSGLQILRILARCPDGPRYSDVVDESWRVLNARGTQEQYQAYRKAVGRKTGDPYQPGSVDIDALRAAQGASALAANPTPERAQALAELPTNATLDEMFARAGGPQHVAFHGVRIENIVSVEIRQLWFYYRGIGRIAYDYQRETGWHQQGFIGDPMAFEEWMPYRGKAAELGLPDANQVALIQLMSGNPSAIKASAQAQTRAEQASGEYMDTAAELLLQRHAQIANTGAVDAYSWLCNVLARQGAVRYAGVLKSVEKATTDEKLKRFAGQRLGIDMTSRGPGYVQGTISLEEQARKYPSLYPQITLVRGLL